LIQYCLAQQMPVFGVCRGLQMLQSYFGGSIEPCWKGRHAQHHPVKIQQSALWGELLDRQMNVNSYHHFGIRAERLSSQLKPFAVTDDGWVEGAYGCDGLAAGVMWHPERDRPFRASDRQIIQTVFSSKE
jgi:putative glutamine amidotransferase